MNGSMYFQLVAWRAALKCEKNGMKHSSGKTLRPHLKKVLGLKLKLRDPHDLYIAEVQKIIDRVQAGEDVKIGE